MVCSWSVLENSTPAYKSPGSILLMTLAQSTLEVYSWAPNRSMLSLPVKTAEETHLLFSCNLVAIYENSLLDEDGERSQSLKESIWERRKFRKSAQSRITHYSTLKPYKILRKNPLNKSQINRCGPTSPRILPDTNYTSYYTARRISRLASGEGEDQDIPHRIDHIKTVSILNTHTEFG